MITRYNPETGDAEILCCPPIGHSQHLGCGSPNICADIKWPHYYDCLDCGCRHDRSQLVWVPSSVAVGNAVQAFLKGVKPAGEGGGWAKVTRDEMLTLQDIISALIISKYHGDEDGCRPIDFQLVDRTKYEPMHYWPVVYNHGDLTEDQQVARMDDLLGNLNIATERVRAAIKIRSFRESENKEKDSAVNDNA